MTPKDLPTYLRPLFWLRNNFPRPAVEAAIASREESIPHLIAGIRFVCEEPDAEGPDGEAYMMHLFAMYLLAQFREESACPEIIKMVRLPEVESLLADSITEGLSRVLASVSGMKTGPIKELVEDTSVYEFVRSAAFEALEIMRHDGRLAPQDHDEYLISLFSILPRERDYLWSALSYACAQYQVVESLPEIRKAFAEGLTDLMYERLENIEAMMDGALSSRLEAAVTRGVITDVIDEMSGWAYNRQALAPALDDRAYGDAEVEAPKIVGRNDPCPCGSGKKYKKCCI